MACLALPALSCAVLAGLRELAATVRAAWHAGQLPPDAFLRTLLSVPRLERDTWVDALLQLGPAPPDTALPQGCVPYLPCDVNTLLQTVEHAELRAHDVIVDVGAGVGRAALLLHLLTGARVLGYELQPDLVAAAKTLMDAHGVSRVSVVQADAAQLAGPALTQGQVYFLYCPFSGARLAQLLTALQAQAKQRALRVCCVNLPLPQQSWLRRHFSSPALDVYHSATPVHG